MKAPIQSEVPSLGALSPLQTTLTFAQERALVQATFTVAVSVEALILGRSESVIIGKINIPDHIFVYLVCLIRT